MKYNKTMSFLLFAVLIAISIMYMLSFTNLTITDTDPSTYVIIPIIMLPIFGFFYIKKNIKIEIKHKDIIFGVFLFIISILLSFYLKIFLSFMFFTYRIDLIILPLILMSLISLLFGIKNIKKFYLLFLYSIFASPIFFLLILQQNILFTIINTKIVYGILSIFFKGITYSAPITIIANGYHIGIGESCVGLGLLIAIIFLLIPVAYFYEGKISKKILWISFGVVLMLLLNILRMSFIAFDWILSGPTNALSLFHEFAGIILFYISIIIVRLLQRKFGLSIPKITNKKINNNKFLIMGIILAILISIIYTLSYYPYNITYVSPYSSINTNSTFGIKNLLNDINGKGYNEEILNYNNKTYAIGLVNSSLGINITKPIVISYDNLSYLYKNVPNFITYNNGITGNIYYVKSNNSNFVVFEEVIPYNNTNNEYGLPNLYIVIPTVSLTKNLCNNTNQLVQYFNNLLFLKFYNKTVTDSLNNAGCIINKVVVI